MNGPEAWRCWVENVGELPPIGSILQFELHDRWIRVAEDDHGGGRADARSALRSELARRRHLASASVALGIGSPCLLFATTCSVAELPGHWSDCAAPEWLLDGPETNARTSRTSCRRITWGNGDELEIIDRIVGGRYDGELAVLSEGTGSIYCPSRGGADLFIRFSTVMWAAHWLFPTSDVETKNGRRA